MWRSPCTWVPHGDMGIVSDHLLRQHFHVDVRVIELLPHLPQLAHGVVQITFAFTPAGEEQNHVSALLHGALPLIGLGHPGLPPVMEGDPSGRLLLAEEGWRLHLGVAEAQVLMEVIQAIDKVAYVTSKYLKMKGVSQCTQYLLFFSYLKYNLYINHG